MNFASAGSGFDDETSAIMNTIPMSEQLKMFKAYLGRLERIVGKEEALRMVNGGLFFVSSGSNDFTMNFSRWRNNSQQLKGKRNVEEYQNVVLQKVEATFKVSSYFSIFLVFP